ncbi:MAG: hypothetical protein RIE59_26900 [Imperialibacter sp.]
MSRSFVAIDMTLVSGGRLETENNARSLISFNRLPGSLSGSEVKRGALASSVKSYYYSSN